ncbi:MAG: co-chaperone DjlA [Mizugakiibacter sp.]|uniref:co-chaperone DjlA n=1 Tax=Mizugakiibacter sp. TaxID=1972610 RepID=UPI0031CACCCB|nr:co-chaperone DjlA [Xanthomonadaceae bacterium]
MKYAGKLIGAAIGLLLFRNPLLALLFAAIGHMVDAGMLKPHPHADVQGYVDPLFALLGAVAKADGRVSEAEIAVAERLMTRLGLDAALRQRAIARFNAGKQPGFDVGLAIGELKHWCGGRRDHAFPVIDMVVETVLAENGVSAGKLKILRRLAWSLGVTEMDLVAMMAMKGYAWTPHGAGADRGGYVPPRRRPDGPDPYAVLGVPRGADARAIKRAYRKLIGEHHPDRLGNLPEDMRRRAERRASEINAAYERIQSERGFT